MTTTTERGNASRTATAPRPAAAQAVPAPKKIKLPRDQDPRNPKLRLQALLDAGSVELITADDDYRRQRLTMGGVADLMGMCVAWSSFAGLWDAQPGHADGQ